MKIIIAGAGKLGIQIARVMSHPSNSVTVIDRDQSRRTELEALAQTTRTRIVIQDATEPAGLELAGAHTADLLIATTGDDADNLVIGLLAKRQFAVPRVAARVNNPDNSWLFQSLWGIDIAVPAEDALVSFIEEATGSRDTVTLLRLNKAAVNIVETTIGERSGATGKAAADITLPMGTLISAIIRGGQPRLPTADILFEVGDEVLVISTAATEDEIDAAFR